MPICDLGVNIHILDFKMAIKKQRRKIGSIVKIMLSGKNATYARILEHQYFAFYDSLTNEEIKLDAIVKKQILFFAGVYKYAITDGRWSIIGVLPLEIELFTPPPLYVKDAIEEKYSIYNHDGTFKDARKEECIGLAKFTVWTPENIEERLRKYYEGDESMKYVGVLT